MARQILFGLLLLVSLGAAIFFFYRTGDLLVAKDYVGGLLYVVSGVALTRAAIEFARLLAHVRADASSP